MKENVKKSKGSDFLGNVEPSKLPPRNLGSEPYPVKMMPLGASSGSLEENSVAGMRAEL